MCRVILGCTLSTDARYARDGRVLKGQERALTKSKYEEDVLVGLDRGKT